MPPMRNFPSGMKTCGIPSMGEIRWVTGVGEATSVGVSEGRVVEITSTVAEGITIVGAMVGMDGVAGS